MVTISGFYISVCAGIFTFRIIGTTFPLVNSQYFLELTRRIKSIVMLFRK